MTQRLVRRHLQQHASVFQLDILDIASAIHRETAIRLNKHTLDIPDSDDVALPQRDIEIAHTDAMFRQHLREHAAAKRNNQRRAGQDPFLGRGQMAADEGGQELEAEDRGEAQHAASQGVAVDDAGERGADGDVGDPIGDVHGGDGAVGDEAEGGEEDDDGDGADDERVQDRGFDIEVGDLDGVGAGDDEGAVVALGA